MHVPIQNLYYLLCYAWDRKLQRELVAAGSEPTQRPEDLLALLLAAQVRWLLRRGLDRGYVTHERHTSSPRGKLRIGETITRSLLVRPQVAVTQDELSFDVLHNRILAVTLDRLARVRTLEERVRKDVLEARARMPPTTALDLRPADLRAITLHRNNAAYGFALDLCRLLLEHVAPTRDGHGYEFQDFRASDQVMGLLFESFVRNFLKREQHDYQVRGAIPIDWAVQASEHDLGLLPRMRTDIWLQHGRDHVILECKYTRAPLRDHHGKLRLTSAHLYQIYAYLRNAEDQLMVRSRSTGVLLYTQVAHRIHADYRFEHRDILVRSLDLSQPWQAIHDDLLELVRELQDRP